MTLSLARAIALVCAPLLLACPEPDGPEAPPWAVVASGMPGALLAVWGTSANDVWAVGADSRDGAGPTVVRFDGEGWSRLDTGEAAGTLWWVFGFADGPVFLGGEGGTILRYQAGSFTKMATPGTGTVYGIWGASPTDVWAVGGDSEASGGFAWRLVGDAWEPEPSLPAELVVDAAIWKVHGSGPDDAWLVGSRGVALHWDGAALSPGETGVGSSLFTIHYYAGSGAGADTGSDSDDSGRYVAVGGSATGIIVERAGPLDPSASWARVTPDPVPPGLSGVSLGPDGSGVAVGSFGAVYTRSPAAGWVAAELGFNLAPTLHGSWIDETGGMWVVGGQIFSPPYDDGVLLHRGAAIPNDGLE
jgi:hypothetical protein